MEKIVMWTTQGASRGDLESALEIVNEYYAGNIQMMDLRETGEGEFRFQLRTIDTDGPGHMVASLMIKQRIPTACYHAKLIFYLELPDEAALHTGKHWLKRDENGFAPWTIPNKGDVQHLCECEDKLKSYNHKRRPKGLWLKIRGLKGR